jgi:hypothetical protein
MTAVERAEAEKRVGELWRRIASGDASAMKVVKLAFDGAPEENIEAGGGDLAARVVAGLLDRLAGPDLHSREAVSRKMAGVQADLEGPRPSPVERLLAQRAAVCWVAAYEADLACLKVGHIIGTRLADHYERRRDRAHRMFLQTVKALVQVAEAAAREASRKSVPVALAVEPTVGKAEGGEVPWLGHLRFGGRLSGSLAGEEN